MIKVKSDSSDVSCHFLIPKGLTYWYNGNKRCERHSKNIYKITFEWINCPQLLKWDFGESWGHSMLCWDLHFKKMLFLFEAADRRTVRDSNMNVLSESKCYSISTALEVEYNGTAFVLSALVWVECTVALETLLSSVSKDFLSLSANWELNFRDAPLWFTVIWPAVIYLHHITDNLRRENRSC